VATRITTIILSEVACTTHGGFTLLVLFGLTECYKFMYAEYYFSRFSLHTNNIIYLYNIIATIYIASSMVGACKGMYVKCVGLVGGRAVD